MFVQNWKPLEHWKIMLFVPTTTTRRKAVRKMIRQTCKNRRYGWHEIQFSRILLLLVPFTVFLMTMLCTHETEWLRWWCWYVKMLFFFHFPDVTHFPVKCVFFWHATDQRQQHFSTYNFVQWNLWNKFKRMISGKHWSFPVSVGSKMSVLTRSY